MKISADLLAASVQKELENYRDATVESMKKAVDSSAKQAVNELKTTSPKMTGAYAKSWTSKKDKQKNKWAYAKVVFNKNHYRLTHLLEKGHRIVNAKNGRTWVEAIAHISTVEQEAVENLVKEIKDNI